MNNQVIKLRANSNHFGHPVTSHDHPAPPVTRIPATNGGKRKQKSSATNGEGASDHSTDRETSKNNVSFSFHHPSAKKVLLAGEFTQWEKQAIAMSNQEGIWRASVELAPGRYRYRFIVDGAWQDDPHAKERMQNPYGSADCVAEVR